MVHSPAEYRDMAQGSIPVLWRQKGKRDRWLGLNPESVLTLGVEPSTLLSCVLWTLKDRGAQSNSWAENVHK